MDVINDKKNCWYKCAVAYLWLEIPLNPLKNNKLKIIISIKLNLVGTLMPYKTHDKPI